MIPNLSLLLWETECSRRSPQKTIRRSIMGSTRVVRCAVLTLIKPGVSLSSPSGFQLALGEINALEHFSFSVIFINGKSFWRMSCRVITKFDRNFIPLIWIIKGQFIDHQNQSIKLSVTFILLQHIQAGIVILRSLAHLVIKLSCVSQVPQFLQTSRAADPFGTQRSCCIWTRYLLLRQFSVPASWYPTFSLEN